MASKTLFPELTKHKNNILSSTTYKGNPFLDKAYVKELEKMIEYDPYMHRVYALGEWAPRKGGSRVYKRFSEKNIISGFRFDPFNELILCVDFNVSPMKWCFVQNISGIDYVFDELAKEDTDTMEMAEAVLNKFGNRDYIIYGDRSGHSATTKSRTTDYAVLQEILPAAEIFLRSRNPPVVDRINAVNNRLCDKNGKIKLFVNDTCKHLIKDLYRVEWAKGKREINKLDLDLTHISDALGYYIEYKYSIKPQQTVYWSRN